MLQQHWQNKALGKITNPLHFLMVVAVMLCFTAASQEGRPIVITWSDLAQVKFSVSNSTNGSTAWQKPNFLAPLQALQGKKVSITGYFLNLNKQNAWYMLSKNPMASCFFCGNGGPETVAMVKFAGKEVFDTDDVVTVTGILRLNGEDPNNSIYLIEQADGLIIR